MRPILRLSLITLCTAWLASSSGVTAHAPNMLEGPIAEPRLTSSNNDEFVVSFAVGGELHGLLTLKLVRSGASASGEWALVTSDVPAGDSEHEHGEEQGEADAPHVDMGPPTFSGTIAGTITSADLVFDAQGTLVAIESAALKVVSGSARFDGTTGSGTAEATSVDPAGANFARGTLRLFLSSTHDQH